MRNEKAIPEPAVDFGRYMGDGNSLRIPSSIPVNRRRFIVVDMVLHPDDIACVNTSSELKSTVGNHRVLGMPGENDVVVINRSLLCANEGI